MTDMIPGAIHAPISFGGPDFRVECVADGETWPCAYIQAADPGPQPAQDAPGATDAPVPPIDTTDGAPAPDAPAPTPTVDPAAPAPTDPAPADPAPADPAAPTAPTVPTLPDAPLGYHWIELAAGEDDGSPSWQLVEDGS